VERLESGGWLLHGERPPELDEVRAEAHGSAALARG
jgi:hypothetical protein